MGARPVVIRERGSDTPPPAVIHLPHSSAVVPPEFRDAIVLDDEELRLELLRMTARGMGVIYTRTSHGDRLREMPTDAERARLINLLYEPHHRALTEAVAA